MRCGQFLFDPGDQKRTQKHVSELAAAETAWKSLQSNYELHLNIQSEERATKMTTGIQSNNFSPSR